MGLFDIPIFAGLFLTFIGLLIILPLQVFAFIVEQAKGKQRLIAIFLIAIVLITTCFYPNGMINFEKLGANNALVAIREGSANCTSNLKLKDDNKFSLRTYCFGIDESTGSYHLQHDTIFFSQVSTGRREHEFYQFALIKPSVFRDSSKYSDIILFKNKSDTVGYIMLITTNDLPQLKSNPH